MPGRAARVRLPLVLACIVLPCFVTEMAFAYRTGGDTQELSNTERVRWEESAISFWIHDASFADVSLEETQQIAFASFAKWMQLGCHSPALALVGTIDVPAELGDGFNTIQWVATGWKDLGYDSDAAAATELEYQADEDGNWRIVEADVLLNGQSHRWTAVLDAPVEGARDLRSVLTHELGHVLGLMHPCEPNGEGGAPSCDGGLESSGTMFPQYSPQQSELDTDSVDGLCFLYSGAATGAAEDDRGGDTEGRDSNRECERNQDCGQDEACVSGNCLVVPRPDGDPCDRRTDCESGRCVEGECLTQCTSDVDCAEGKPCSLWNPRDDASGLYCGVTLGALGAECASSLDCLADECLEGAEPFPVCTRTCGPHEAECPADWSCEQVDVELVCVPPATPPAASCRVVTRSNMVGWWTLSIALMLVWYRRHRILALPGRKNRRRGSNV